MASVDVHMSLLICTRTTTAKASAFASSFFKRQRTFQIALRDDLTGEDLSGSKDAAFGIAGPRAASGRRQTDAGAGPVSPPVLGPAWLPALPRRNLWEEHLKKFTRVRGAQKKCSSCMPRQLNAGVLQWDEAHPSVQWQSITWFVVAFLYIFSPARGWWFEPGPGVPTYFTHTHTCAPDFWPKGYKTLSKFVKYNGVKGTLPSLHYPLLQSCGRAPRNLTWQSATTFCSDVTPIEKMIFDCHVGFRGSYIYIPRAHTHFLTHRSNPQTWRRYDGARANVLHYDAAKNRSMVFRKTLKQKPRWLEMTWRCGEIGEMISR